MAKEIKIAPINMGGGKAGALSPTPPVPVAVPEHVHVSPDKPYTLRLDIATMDRLEAYCAAHKGRGKGPIISEAVNRWLDAAEED